MTKQYYSEQSARKWAISQDEEAINFDYRGSGKAWKRMRCLSWPLKYK